MIHFYTPVMEATIGKPDYVGFPTELSSVLFVDSLKGWITGGRSIFRTSNGGISWDLQITLPGHPGYSEVASSIDFVDNEKGWVVGGIFSGGDWLSGIILHTENGGISGIENDFLKNNNTPARYILAQNYPNPFNPNTVISWQLAVSSPVKITVYNITGQEVATLVNERKPAGIHSVEWDAANFASGVYLYRLEAGDFVETRKMVVMK